MKHSIRFQHIDVLRAIAILLMFYAHLLPHFTENGEEIYFLERLASSLAAPIFLFLVGYNFLPSSSMLNTIKRVIIVLSYACLIDVLIWGIYPFYSFDVLYTIGLSLIFLQLITRFLIGFKLVILLGIIVAMFAIWKFNFYLLTLDEPYIGESYKMSNVLFNLIINGWFPIIPWFIFPLLGYLAQSQKINKLFAVVVGGITFFTMLFFFHDSSFGIRPFAVEIFYPADWVYLIIAISWLLILWSIRNIFDNSFFKFLNPLGKASFFLYGLHLFCYHLFADRLIDMGLLKWQVFLFFLIVFYLSALILDAMKTKWPFYAKNQILRIIIGG